MITLTVKGLTAPIKRHRVAEWIRKHDLHICCIQETHLRTKDLHKLKVKGWKKNIPSKWTGKKSWGSNTYVRQNRHQTKGHKRDTEGHFTIFKGRIHQEDININSKYAPNVGALKYVRKNLQDFKKDTDSNTIIVGDFNTHCQKWTDLPNKVSTKILQH